MDIDIDIDLDQLDHDDVAFEGSEGEELSLEGVIQLMEESWQNEKFAPELLPYRTEIVEILLGQINYMGNKLEEIDSTDVKKDIHQMELDRLKFLVTSYLRLRLEKIETFSAFILQQEKQRIDKNEDPYLSPSEMEYAQDYEENLKKHFESVMSFCPGASDQQAQIVTPNIHSMVFVKSKKDIEGVALDDGSGENNDLIDFAKGSQVLVSYNSVAKLVKEGDVYLC